MTYVMKPLSCDPNRIRGMSERMILSRSKNNYGGAVKRLNLIDEKLAELDYANIPGFVVNGLKREQLIATNSMILHEVFFESLGDESEPGPNLMEALARNFGSYERWRAEFVAMGKALGGGSGWVMLTWSPRDRKLVNQWASDHCHTMAGAAPILALDMYEHSYHMDYGAKLQIMWTSSWRRSIGPLCNVRMTSCRNEDGGSSRSSSWQTTMRRKQVGRHPIEGGSPCS